MRLFVAVDPPPAAADHLAEMVSALEVARPAEPGRSTRLADPTRWHVTLAFIGEVDEERAPDAAEALGRAASAAAEPIRVRVAGGGRFGRGRFTIMWAGMQGDLEGLTGFAAIVRRELRRSRVPFDRKQFRAHLTLARPGDRITAAQLESDLAALEGYVGPQWTVDAVHLYSSKLGAHPEYERIASHPLPQR